MKRTLFIFILLTATRGLAGLDLIPLTPEKATVCVTQGQLSPITQENQSHCKTTKVCVIRGELNALTKNNKKSCETTEKCRINGVITEKNELNANLCEKVEYSRVRRLLDKNKIKGSLKLIDVELSDAVKASLKYKYKVYPNKKNEFFTRIDSYELKGDLKPGDLLDDTPIFLNMNNKAIITFAQQFEDGKSARSLKSTYTLKDLPSSAKKAKKLKVGDYVSFNVNMNLALGVSQSWLAVDLPLEAKAQLSFIASGEYQVHIYKVSDQKVRIKLIGLRKKGRNLSTKIGFDDDSFEIFGVDQLDRKIIKLSDLDQVIKYNKSKTKDNVLLLDYTVDLADSQAAIAYDELFNSMKKLNTYKIANPTIKPSLLKDFLISNIQKLEELSNQQLHMSHEHRSVVRNFKGSNEPSSVSQRFDYGMLTFRKEKKTSLRDNYLVGYKANSKTEKNYYIYPSWNRKVEREQGFISKIFDIGKSNDESLTQTANAVFVSNENKEIKEFIDINFTYNYKDYKTKPEELYQISDHIGQLLPNQSEFYKFMQQLKDKDWFDTNGAERTNIQISYSFNANSYRDLLSPIFKRTNNSIKNKEVARMSRLEYEFYRYLDILKIYENSLNSKNNRWFFNKPEFKGEGRLAAIKFLAHPEGPMAVKKLTQALNPSLNNHERYDQLIGLTKSSLFRKHGPGFMLYLLKKLNTTSEMKHQYHLNIHMMAANKEPVQFKFGTKPESPHNEAIRFIDFVLNSDNSNIQQWHDLQEMLQKTTLVEPEVNTAATAGI